MKKNTKQLFFGNEEQAAEQATEQKKTQEQKARRSQSEKVAATVKEKKEDALELMTSPYTEPTTHGFPVFPTRGRLYILPTKLETSQEVETAFPEFTRSAREQVQKEKFAFVTLKDENGNRIIRPTLSKRESALTVALLEEFISQTRTFQDDLNARKAALEQNEKIRKENALAERWNASHDDKREIQEEVPVPLVRIGQDADGLNYVVRKDEDGNVLEEEKVLQVLFAKFGVSPVETFFDGNWKTYVKTKTKDGFLAFSGEHDTFVCYDRKTKDEVEQFFCYNVKDQNDRVTITKHKPDKFIFLNLSKFWKKYFKHDLQSVEYRRTFDMIQDLGTKRVPCFSENGSLRISQFFTTHTNFARFGRDFYALLVMNTPDVFDGVDTGDNFLKLRECFEDILADASDVELRFWLDLMDMKKTKKLERVFTVQEVFERYGTTADVIKNDHFGAFWEKFKTAALHLMKDGTLVYITKNGKQLTEAGKVERTDKVAFGLNKNMMTRQTPKLSASV